MEESLREGIVAVIKNQQDKVLVFERSDVPNQFQFPQGGIDKGETHQEALYRELKEEIGTNEIEILRESDELISYLYPTYLKSKASKSYKGQTQKWYLVTLNSGISPDLSISDGEFISYKWCTLKEAYDGITEWKKECYLKGFLSLGLKIDGI